MPARWGQIYGKIPTKSPRLTEVDNNEEQTNDLDHFNKLSSPI